MKKLVLAVLAIGAMAACTKSNVQYEQPGEISLQPVAQKATKAAVDGTNYPTGEAYNFNVWAWWGDYNAGTELAYFTVTTPFIAQGTFKHRNDNSWGGVTPYYWPTKGSLVFAGYSPADALSFYPLLLHPVCLLSYPVPKSPDKTLFGSAQTPVSYPIFSLPLQGVLWCLTSQFLPYFTNKDFLS